MNNKVKNGQMAEFMFDLLGIKDVTKPWQKEKGTQVFELPFKTMYANGYKEVNRFTIYKSGYVRKMLVNSKGASWCCYQLNRTRTNDEYYKDYDCNGKWTGKYRKSNRKERIMIPNYEDRLVYLCNYILKNYYRKQSGASFYRIYDYQVDIIKQLAKEDKARYDEQLPFNGHYANPVHPEPEDVQVIINGHRYNLS
jgi:hypothetical protein